MVPAGRFGWVWGPSGPGAVKLCRLAVELFDVGAESRVRVV